MYDHWKLMLSDNPTNKKLHNKLTAIFRAGYESPLYDLIFETGGNQLAYAMEVFWIAVIGRKNLCNLTDGGEVYFPQKNGHGNLVNCYGLWSDQNAALRSRS
jgi:hypothetical protein